MVRKIAAGGMAEVWMGRRTAMGGASKTVAIKLLAAHLAENPVYRRMFVDEARLSMMLSHSNLVQVFDVGEQSGRSYLVMEWVDGLDLARLIAVMRDAGESLEFAVIGHVIGEVLRGLAYAHELGGDERTAIVHRDISPHNVLLSVSGEVKISDFGVARLTTEETSGLHVRGKLRYMPPEQVRGDSKHPTIDLFAAGALLHEMLDGVRFRAGLERDELFGMVLAGVVPPLVRQGVPAELEALREGLLAADRSERIPSAAQALALLRRWSGYRNVSDELAVLVRRFVGVAAPRSGLGVEPSDEQIQLGEEPTTIEGEPKPGSSEVATRTIPTETGSETTPTLERRRRITESSERVRRGPLAGLAMFVLLGLGLGLGFGGAWMVGELRATLDDPKVARPAEPSFDRAVEEEVEPLAPASVDVAPLVAEPTPASEPTPTLEPRPTLEPTPSTSPRPRERADKPKATVEFAAHQFFFVWIKVDGKQYALEPVASVTLPAGRHTVYLREDTKADWVEAGRIKIEPGRRYRVKLSKPAGLALQRLD
ncbi:protein kinase domain-containing protein [Nannocystaceae bacterium ST9]